MGCLGQEGLSCTLALSNAFSECSPCSPSSPRAAPGTRDLVAAETRPMANKGIPALINAAMEPKQE